MTCTHHNSDVYDSRPRKEPYMGIPSIRRRNRTCRDCGKRFTTYEVEKAELVKLVTIARGVRKLVGGD